MLDNIDNTFVTPVFNGSASLRDAAGQLIENTVKSVRRGETVDEAYIDGLYSDVSSLYRLDQVSSRTGGKTDFGPLPAEAKALLATLAVVWILILFYIVIDAKNKKNLKK
jgi:multiple sugar transport system substrate-binding protein